MLIPAWILNVLEMDKREHGISSLQLLLENLVYIQDQGRWEDITELLALFMYLDCTTLLKVGMLRYTFSCRHYYQGSWLLFLTKVNSDLKDDPMRKQYLRGLLSELIIPTKSDSIIDHLTEGLDIKINSEIMRMQDEPSSY